MQNILQNSLPSLRQILFFRNVNVLYDEMIYAKMKTRQDDTAILEDFGLTQVGVWELNEKYASTKHLGHLPGLNFHLKNNYLNTNNVVYAFVVENRVIYVGETTKGMKERFVSYRYGNPVERDTDNRVKNKITEFLLSQKQVLIFASEPIAFLSLPNRKIKIPASKPLEEMLIDVLSPELNTKNIGSNTSCLLS